jgi:hypothetical protein
MKVEKIDEQLGLSTARVELEQFIPGKFKSELGTLSSD